MINYVLYQNKNRENDSYGKWFARAVHQLVEFDEFIEHMAKHHCVYSEGTIKGVLIEMECCLREVLLEGKAVRFDELGIFSLGISNTKGGAASAYDFNVSKNIESVRMNLYLGKRFLARNLREDAVFREAKLYDIDSTKPADGENATQPTGGSTSGGNTGGNTGGSGSGDDDVTYD
jgi:predicted histone-like DNA-binding protein